jgi:hypothetical protein
MKISFKNKKFFVCKKALSEEMADFLYKYFLLKRHVANTMFNDHLISSD